MNKDQIKESTKAEWDKQIWLKIDIIEREPYANDTEKQVLVAYLKMQLYKRGE